MIEAFIVFVYNFGATKLSLIDRWLCCKLPWYFRLPWRSAWVRSDESHPSLRHDENALREKILFLKNLRLLKFRFFGIRPIGKMARQEKERQARILRTIERKERKKYEDNLSRRQEKAKRRTGTPSLS
jgi:hypothetical protein